MPGDGGGGKRGGPGGECFSFLATRGGLLSINTHCHYRRRLFPLSLITRGFGVLLSYPKTPN
jgi:hypothetical protein